MRKAIQIDTETHKRLKMLSAEHGVTMMELVREVVNDCNMIHVLNLIEEGKKDE